jgi:hypothetical protein
MAERASVFVTIVVLPFIVSVLGANSTRPGRTFEVSHRDGVDDTEALQRAIDRASVEGGSVHIRSGLYRLNIRDGVRALAPKRNVRLIGDGPDRTVLRLNPAQDAYEGIVFQAPDSTQDVSGFSLENLAIDQNTAGNPMSDAATLARKPRFVLAIFDGSSIRIENCRFTDIAGTNTLVFNGPRVSDIRITSNRFENVGTVSGLHYDHSTIYTHAERVYVAGNTETSRLCRRI